MEGIVLSLETINPISSIPQFNTAAHAVTARSYFALEDKKDFTFALLCSIPELYVSCANLEQLLIKF